MLNMLKMVNAEVAALTMLDLSNASDTIALTLTYIVNVVFQYMPITCVVPYLYFINTIVEDKASQLLHLLDIYADLVIHQ